MKPKSTPHFSLGQTVFRTILVGLGVVGFSTWLNAAPTPAGTNITNQATAEYKDQLGASHTVTSNIVTTVVQPVGALLLVADASKEIGTTGGVLSFPHTLTNTGNSTDSFTLTALDANTGNIPFTNVKLYADTNGNGIYDAGVDLQITAPVSLDSTDSFDFFVVATVPTGRSDGDTDTITVTATGTPIGGSTATADNTDTVTVKGNAALISVVKTIDQSSGIPGSGPYTYRIRYENTGDLAAAEVLLYDAIPTGMTYVTESAVWSGGGSPDDANDGSDGGTGGSIDYRASSNVVTALVTMTGGLAPGASGFLTFQVTVDPGATPGSTITNEPKFCYSDANGVTPAPCNNGSDAVDPTKGDLGDPGTPVDFLVTNFSLVKTQALDLACDGTCGGTCTYVTTNLTTGAVPGACIKYQVTASNLTGEQVTDVVITDHTPSFTAYNCASGTAATTVGFISTVPACGNTGDVVATVGTLADTGTAVLTFGVKIDE